MIRILRYIKKYWFFAILAPLFMVGEVAMDMLLSRYMQQMVDFGIQTGNMANILRYGLAMLLIVLAGVASGILSGVFTNLTSFKFANDLRKDVFRKIMDLSYHQTDKFSTGSLVTRVTNDVTQVQNLISMALRMLIRAGSFFVLGIVFTLSISKDFGILLAIALPVQTVLVVIFIKLLFPVFSQIQKKLDRVNTVVHENVSGLRVVKAFTKEAHETARFGEANDDYTEKTLYVGKLFSLLMPLLMLIVYVMQLVIYKIGGQSIFNAYFGLIGSGEMLMVGEISQAITYIFMIFMSIMMLGMMFSNMAKAFASAKRLNEILDTVPDIADGKASTETLPETGTVEFRDVSFQYPGAEQSILSHVSLRVNKGETLAVVGATGSGKTSLVNLVPRFYDATSGTVLVDGLDVRSYPQEVLRNRISICLQTAELFSGSIAENLRWGKPEATEEEIRRAAAIAQAAEFIEAKAGGYEEKVEERGTSLSGGQKQRMSIARALLRVPEILIFDDATSALDLVTEAKLYQEMNGAYPGMTKIIVVQRAATARNADRIAVLDGGKIIACDTHERLMETCPLYRDIYESQLKDGDLHE